MEAADEHIDGGLMKWAHFAGTTFVCYYFFKFLLKLYRGFQLYIWSQYFSQVDLKKRYGEWAVVSGATDGIGLEMARELARRGHSLVIIGRNAQKLANSKATLECEPNVGEVVTVQIDLSDSSLENFERIRSQIGADKRDIGILINNAGAAPTAFKRFNDFDLEFLRNIVNVNIAAAIFLTRMIMPRMVERRKGLVINNSSMVSAVVGPYMGLYGPTKTFLKAFSESLRMEYAGSPIDIIDLAPGIVCTKMIAATGHFSTPNIINVTSDSFAKAALNAVSTRIGSMSGHIVHGLYHELAVLPRILGLVNFLFKVVGYLGGMDITSKTMFSKAHCA